MYVQCSERLSVVTFLNYQVLCETLQSQYERLQYPETLHG